jgi:D-alanine-D-alanine ligase
MIGVPFTGCDVKGAVVGQDKIYMKMLFNENDIPTTKFISFVASEYEINESSILNRISKLNYPLFVKPSSLGSSVGINRVNDEKELTAAIEEAMTYDKRIIVEEGVSNLIEVNCSVLGDYENQEVADVEEVMGNDEFLSFNDKYLSGGSSKNGSKSGMAATNRIIPARISDELMSEVKETAKKVFRVLNTSGVCRIDFLIDSKENKVYVNEINTIPGSLAFYLWESIDVDFTDLVNRIVELAIKREREKEKLIFTYDSNILSNFSGSKASKLK